jgi:hypothetical protein
MPRRYVTSLQTSGTMPGDLIPPGGSGWELHSYVFDKNGNLVIAWVREEKPCPACGCQLPGCRAHGPWPHCETCLGTGRVPA